MLLCAVFLLSFVHQAISESLKDLVIEADDMTVLIGGPLTGRGLQLWQHLHGIENQNVTESRKRDDHTSFNLPPPGKLPLQSCFYDANGYACCNREFRDFLKDTFHDITRRSPYSYCNIQYIANHIQAESQTKYKVDFEVIVALDDFAQKIRFRGNMACKFQIESKYLLVYATPVGGPLPIIPDSTTAPKTTTQRTGNGGKKNGDDDDHGGEDADATSGNGEQTGYPTGAPPGRAPYRPPSTQRTRGPYDAPLTPTSTLPTTPRKTGGYRSKRVVRDADPANLANIYESYF